MRRLILLTLLTLGPGCLYRAGGNLVAGMVDEAAGQRRTDGVDGVAQDLLEREVVAQLGHQLGQGVTSGAVEMTEDERQALEDLVDGVLHVAALRTGTGLREEVSPELRAMVRRDIVDALAEGMRGSVASSAEEVADRVVSQAMGSLQRGIEDPDLRLALADLLRDSVYLAMEEGRPGRPGVGQTLETTLDQHLLRPVEFSAQSITNQVADQVEVSARRTEATLQAIIGALVVILGVVVLLYWISRRQLVREREVSQGAQTDLRNLDAAMSVLDDAARERLGGKLEEYRAVARGVETSAPAAERRTSEYTRREP